MPDYRLDEKQRQLVEENLALVGAVIRDKVYDPDKLGIFSREDLFQIGSEGLCKAAFTYRESGRGKFSTYAYRVIYNKIQDAMRYSTVRRRRETPLGRNVLARHTPDVADAYSQQMDAFVLLDKALDPANKAIKKGARALLLRLDGYSMEEICSKLDAKEGTVRTWITRARQYLRKDPGLAGLAASMDL